MKYIGVILLLVATAVADSPLPSCALSCAVSAIAAAGNCTISDSPCLCKSAAFQTTFSTCVQSFCGPTDVNIALTYGQQRCIAVGITSGVATPFSTVTTATSTSSTNISASATPTTSANVTSSPIAASTASPTASSGADQSAIQSTNGKTIGIGVGVGIGGVVTLGILGWFFFRRRFEVRKRPHSDTETEYGTAKSVVSELDDKSTVTGDVMQYYTTKPLPEIHAKPPSEMAHPRDSYAILSPDSHKKWHYPATSTAPAELWAHPVKRP